MARRACYRGIIKETIWPTTGLLHMTDWGRLSITYLRFGLNTCKTWCAQWYFAFPISSFVKTSTIRWNHWQQITLDKKIQPFFVPWTSIDERSSTFYAEYRYVYRIFLSGRVSKIQRNWNVQKRTLCAHETGRDFPPKCWGVWLLPVIGVRYIPLQCPATVCQNTWGPLALVPLFCSYNILVKTFTVFVTEFAEIFWEKIQMWLQKVDFQSHIATHSFLRSQQFLRGPGSSVGIATDYGVDGPGSNPGGTRFSAVQTGSGAYPASCTMGTRVFPGGRGVGLTPPLSSAEGPRKE